MKKLVLVVASIFLALAVTSVGYTAEPLQVTGVTFREGEPTLPVTFRSSGDPYGAVLKVDVSFYNTAGDPLGAASGLCHIVNPEAPEGGNYVFDAKIPIDRRTLSRKIVEAYHNRKLGSNAIVSAQSPDGWFENIANASVPLIATVTSRPPRPAPARTNY